MKCLVDLSLIFLFIILKDMYPIQLKKSAIESLFTRIRRKQGIKNFSPHRLRHSLSTEMYSNGCDLIQISSILGHSNVNTTKRYIHPDLKKKLDNYDKYHKKRSS